jgi:hypothetical protein
MRNEWLAASSFEHIQRIIAAITTLSIHTKLVLAGRDDPTSQDEIQRARTYLLDFVEQLQRCVRDMERGHVGVALGTDPRFSELATRYLTGTRQHTTESPLYRYSFDEAKHLLDSADTSDFSARIIYLRDLRALLEQHTQADVIGLLGDI